jgi:hypothetical protein
MRYRSSELFSLTNAGLDYREASDAREFQRSEILDDFQCPTVLPL